MQSDKKDEGESYPLLPRDPSSSSSSSFPPDTKQFSPDSKQAFSVRASSPGTPPPIYYSHQQASSSTSKSAFEFSEQPSPPTKMASFMMSPYPAQDVPREAPYGAVAPARAPGEYEREEGREYPPYPNQPGTGSYLWRSDDNLDSTALNEKRRAALDEVDKAYFSWFHAKVVAIVGAGFFTDAYDTFVIDIVTTMLGLVYVEANANVFDNHQSQEFVMLSSTKELGLKVAGPVGTFFGMLIFGYLGDRLGRKRMYGMELMIIIFAVFVQALLGQARAVNIINALILWRFIMGIGIGGDYPASAVIASEYAPIATRGRMMTAVFATQGLGQLTGAIVSVILVAIYKKSSDTSTPDQIDQMWRILVGFGCVPGALALVFRFTIPETPRFTMDIERNVNQASQDVDTFLRTGSYFVNPDATVEHVRAPEASLADWLRYFGIRRNLFVLIGTCYSWFALDIAFYGLSLNSSKFLQGIFPLQETDTALTLLQNAAKRTTIPICTGLIPGYVAAFFLVDKFGRRRLQLIGFSALFSLLLIMGVAFPKLSEQANSKNQIAFLVLYCIASFFLNCGPNTTTFIIAGESFPTRYRSTMNGVAAASGKFGAIISQVVVFELNRNPTDNNASSMRIVLIIFAVFMLSGIVSTVLTPETMNMSLEDNSNEDQKDFIFGPAVERHNSQ